MSATRTKSYRFSHDLADAIELRAKELGYASGTDLMKSLARYDCLCRSSHGVTTQWAKLPLEDQDRLDNKLLSLTLRKQGMSAKDASKLDWRNL